MQEFEGLCPVLFVGTVKELDDLSWQSHPRKNQFLRIEVILRFWSMVETPREQVEMFKKSLNFPGLVLLGFWLTLPCLGAKPPLYVQLTTGQHQLFLDDYLIGALYRVERRINQPAKYEGNPLISADKPWEQGPGPYWNPSTQKVLQIRSAPCWDPEEQVWKLWYFTAHKTAYAFSRD